LHWDQVRYYYWGVSANSVLDDLPVFTEVTFSRHRWFWIRALVCAAALLALLGGATSELAQGQEKDDLTKIKEEVARIRAAGEPIYIDELYARNRVPAGTRDVSPLWLAALNSVDEERFFSDAKEELPYVGRGESLAPGDVEAAEELLAKYDATVQATLRAAAHGGECRLPHEFSDGILASVDLADRMRRVLAKLMALRGRVAAARGERERAFESILAIWEIGRGLDHQGFGVLLRRVTVEDLASEEVEFLLNEFPLNAEELARLRTKVEAADIQASLLAACYVERAKGYDFFLNFDVDDFEKRSDEDRGVITRGIDCRFFLESYREVVSAVQGPLVQAQVRANKVTEQIESIDRSRDFLAKDERTVTLHFMPGVGPMVACIASRKAYRDTILAAIASRQYEQEHGKLPASLEDLTPKYLPAVPIDSDEKPLRFKPAEEGILIYSVGRNGQDNGGVRVDSWLDSDTVVHLKPTRRRAAEK
jgi:hypothetical protein